MATLNACEMYGMKNKGAIAPSYVADIVVADDLNLSSISQVYKNGKLVCENGKALFECETVDDSKLQIPFICRKYQTTSSRLMLKTNLTLLNLYPKVLSQKRLLYRIPTAFLKYALSNVIII